VAKKAGRHSRSITPHPGEIRERLECLARNLHWSWDAQTAMLFESLDPALWRAVDRNPLRVIRSVDAARWAVLADDRGFRDRLAACEGSLRDYLRTKPWFARSASRREKKLHVAYFCAEYAVHECMQIYAGGLGVLAGDHLKSASDLGIPLTAIGLLYRHGYYRQQLQSDGSTRVVYPTYDYADWPIEDTGLEIEIPLMRRTIRARIWKMMVGRVELYLLDTDLADNKPKDREITRFLYGGDSEYRVQQEVVLGIGGRIALDALGIEPTVYHLNEGHAAFCALERVRRFMLEGAGIDDAMQAVRQSSVFTTHTPVPAGNDRFEPTLTWKYLGPMAREMGLSRRQLLTLGREDPTDLTEPFCMTVLALKLSEHCNGVAELHGDTSRRMWMKTYDADSPADVPIRHVTNGIHVQTWLAPEASRLYDRYLKPKWNGAGPDDDWWAKVDRIPPAELWAMRNMLRARMITFIRGRLARQIARRGGPIEDLIAAHETFSDEALTIGFARRFATYKRAPLIFRDARRLASIVGDPDRPVQFVFAGKAHPLDPEGKAFIQRIYRHAHRAGFRGRVVIIEDYDMQIGRMLTSGCDVWLNNPVRPMEASGTSGMKPPLHGGINCSILDGWWPEGYNRRNGWAIGDGRVLSSRARQDAYDAECIYDLLEQEIVPMFYKRNRSGVPTRWVKRMAASMKTIPAQFSTHRMLADYLDGFYLPAHNSA
jgi:starch phosphorylase